MPKPLAAPIGLLSLSTKPVRHIARITRDDDLVARLAHQDVIGLHSEAVSKWLGWPTSMPDLPINREQEQVPHERLARG